MKEKRAKYRKSNFELLRILAMLDIIVYHLVLHHLDYNRFALIDETLGSNFYHLEIIQLFYTLGQTPMRAIALTKQNENKVYKVIDLQPIS